MEGIDRIWKEFMKNDVFSCIEGLLTSKNDANVILFNYKITHMNNVMS